jgi:hypothetical protein
MTYNTGLLLTERIPQENGLLKIIQEPDVQDTEGNIYSLSGVRVCNK